MAWIRDRYDEAFKETRGCARQYWLNHAFYSGFQWLGWNHRTHNLVELPSEPDRLQITVNRMKANVRTIMSYVCQRELGFEVLPNRADDAAILGAKLAQNLCESARITHSWELRREEAWLSCLKGGTSAICIDWDPDAGTTVGVVDSKDVRQGDTYETTLSIAEFVVEPGSQDAETARWWIKCQALPPKVVREMLGLSKDPPADLTANIGAFQHKLLSTNDNGVGQLVPLTLVLTYYERPNSLTKKGRIAVEVDGKIHHDREWPFPFKERLNLVVLRESVIEDQWFGDTVLSAARPIQAAFNLAWTNLLEHLTTVGAAKMVASQATIAAIEYMDDMPGAWVPYPTGENPPVYMNPPQLPAWMRDLPGQLAVELDDLMGVHDVSRGEAPPNIESGLGIEILGEKDATPIGKMVKDLALAWGRLATMFLQIQEKMVKETRRGSVQVGRFPQEFEWTGADLKGQTTAHVPVESVMPRSKAMMRQFAGELFDRGLIKSLEEYLKISEAPGYLNTLYSVNPDLAMATEENHLMSTGQVCLPKEWEDHIIHMETHNRFRKSAAYAQLGKKDKDLIDTHIEAHRTAAAQELGKQRVGQTLDPQLPMIDQAANSAQPVLPPDALMGGAPPEPEAPTPPAMEAMMNGSPVPPGLPPA